MVITYIRGLITPLRTTHPKALNIGAKKKTAPLHLLRVCEANHLAGQAGDNLSFQLGPGSCI